MGNELPLADCIEAPSPCAPWTSAKGFIAIGTSAMCDLPSEPLYTRQIFGMSARRGGFRHPADHHGFVHGGRVDFQDLDVVGAVELVVHDPGGLQDAVALAEGMLDDVGAELPVRRLLDAEIPVLHEAPQAG